MVVQNHLTYFIFILGVRFSKRYPFIHRFYNIYRITLLDNGIIDLQLLLLIWKSLNHAAVSRVNELNDYLRGGEQIKITFLRLFFKCSTTLNVALHADTALLPNLHLTFFLF